MSDDGKGARWLCSGGDIPLKDGTPRDMWAVAKWPDAPAGVSKVGLLVGEDGPVYVASPEEWAEVQRAAGLGPRATGEDVVAAFVEADRLRTAVADAIAASDNGGGSASDAIQDMLLILGKAVPS